MFRSLAPGARSGCIAHSGLAAFAMIAGTAQAQIGIEAIGIPGPGGTSQAFGVSADGSVVTGYTSAIVPPAPNPVYEAFRWTQAGGLVGLGDLAGGTFESRAFATDADGSVCVGSSSATGGTNAFRWTQPGGILSIGELAGGLIDAAATGVSASGDVVVGYSFSSNGVEAFRWTQAGGMVGIGDLPGANFTSAANGVSSDGMVIVGYSISANGTEAFMWTQAGGMVGLGDLAGGAFSSNAAAVSVNGTVIVGSATSAEGTQAVRWEGGVIHPLGDLPGGAFSSSAAAMGGNIIVGTATTADGQRAFMWNPQIGMRDLGEYLAALGVNMTGWRLDAATGASSDGTVIVGYGQSPSLTLTGFVARIPRYCEPNCDGSTVAPVLNVNDFVCFNNRFVAGDPYTNCDLSTLAPVLNVNDYICFIGKYGTGCP